MICFVLQIRVPRYVVLRIADTLVTPRLYKNLGIVGSQGWALMHVARVQLLGTATTIATDCMWRVMFVRHMRATRAGAVAECTKLKTE